MNYISEFKVLIFKSYLLLTHIFYIHQSGISGEGSLVRNLSCNRFLGYIREHRPTEFGVAMAVCFDSGVYRK